MFEAGLVDWKYKTGGETPDFSVFFTESFPGKAAMSTSGVQGFIMQWSEVLLILKGEKN